MRKWGVGLGASVIVAYAILGGFVANDWGVTAASGHPLPETIRAMADAGEAYDPWAGVLFAAVGVVLAAAWVLLVTLAPRFPAWLAVVLWGAIIFYGGPALWFATFGNLNSIGDTYYDWNSTAANLWFAPFGVVSLLAGIVGLVGFIRTIVAANKSLKAQGQ